MESEFEMSVRQFLARPPFLLRNLSPEHLALFCDALTHDSYSNEKGCGSYERLEFLGDAVLEFLVCENVYLATDLKEGAMTDYKQDKVANHMLSARILSYGLDIDGIMRVGGGHRGPDGRAIVEENMRADSFEALMAAVYLSRGMDEVRRIVTDVILGDADGMPESDP